MRRRHPIRDEAFEAILHGQTVEQPDDLAPVGGLVADLRAAYQVGVFQPSAELTAFMAAPLAPGQVATDALPVGRPAPKRRKARMLSGLSGFLATLTGKVVLGTAVAAASVGALHAGDAIDVPGLPEAGRDRAAEHEDAVETHNGNDELPDEAVEGKQTAEENHAAATAYTDAVREWTECVSENAQAQGDETTRVTGGFDPRDGCGDHPNPHDFRDTDVPSQADEEGKEHGGGPPESTPGHEGTPGPEGTAGEDDVPDAEEDEDEDEDPGSSAGHGRP